MSMSISREYGFRNSRGPGSRTVHKPDTTLSKNGAFRSHAVGGFFAKTLQRGENLDIGMVYAPVSSQFDDYERERINT